MELQSLTSPPLLWGRLSNHANSYGIVVAVLAIVVVTMVFAVVLLTIRKRTVAGGKKSQVESGMMDELRRLRDTGQMSPEEYERIRAAYRAKASEAFKGGPPRTTPSRSASSKPARPRPAADKAEERVAPPGFDLTGAPLPLPRRADEPTGPDFPGSTDNP